MYVSVTNALALCRTAGACDRLGTESSEVLIVHGSTELLMIHDKTDAR